MTDTGQVPGENHPDSAGMVDQQGVPAPVQIPAPLPAGYAFQDLMDNPAEPEDEELLLMPSGQGAWSDPQVVPPAPAFPVYGAEQAYPEAPVYTEPAAYPEFPSYGAGAHEAGGRDSGSLDLGGLVVPPPAAAAPVAPAAPVRRPLHMGPPVPDATGGVVRSLADRGPAAAPTPVHQPGPPTTGPEYLDTPAAPGPQLSEIPPQTGAPWTPLPPLAEQQQQQPQPVAQDAAAPVAQPDAAPEPAPQAPEAPAEQMAPPAEPEPLPAAPVPVEPPAEPVESEPVPAEPEAGPAAPVAQAAAPEAAPAAVEAQPEPAPVEPLPAEPVVAESAPAEPVTAEPVVPESAPAEPLAAEAAPAEPVPAEPLPPVAGPGEPVPAEAVAPDAVAVEAGPEAHPAAEPVAEAPAEPVTPAPGEVQPAAAEPAQPVEADPAGPAAAEAAEPLPVAEPAAEPAEPAAGEAAPGYDDAEREAVLRVMRERRDIRKGFRTDPIPHEVLLRVLEAAHTAPSVGHSQPWDFVVIRSAETRRTMHELAQRQREAYANSLPKARAKQFKELKIEAILDTPVNIVVTADPTRGGRHTLGRHTQPQMAPYSSALAVENLWLAARAEGLGVGWVSFFDEREMVRELGLPEHLEVVAYLCVGYVDEFPEEPELAQAGWSQRRPLSWVVHEETYGRRALPGEEPHDLLSETVASIRPLDAKALGEAWERQKRMTKPAGALGMLEIISAQLAGLSRVCPPPIPEPAAVAIFAGDHGVHAQGVTPWPQEVTTQMVANFLGGGAVCNAFANQVGAEVCVIDVGVAGDLPSTPGLLPG
ncbi:5,6-dimethylbenzimidazole synthase, partial [Streptomyces sp. NPDC054787]